MQQKVFKNVDLYKDEDEWLDAVWLHPKRFKNKLLAHLQDTLEVTIPQNFFEIYETPRDLCHAGGFVESAFILKPNDLNEWELRHNKTLYKKSKNPVLILAFYRDKLNHEYDLRSQDVLAGREAAANGPREDRDRADGEAPARPYCSQILIILI